MGEWCDRLEKLFHPRLLDLRKRWKILHHLNVLKHLARGTATAVTEAVCHEQIFLQFFLLEVLPCAEGLFGICHRVVRAGIFTTELFDRAEVRQDLCAINALPHKRVVRQTIVLTPTNLDSHEIFETRLLDELWKRPGITKHIRQPQHGTLCIFTEMLTEECAT